MVRFRSPVLGGGRGGHPHENGRALADGRFDLERRADERGALLHTQQSEALAGRPRVAGIESHAVVFDDQQDVVGAAFQDHIDVPGARVLGDVRQRLLRDAVQRRLGFRGETIVRAGPTSAVPRRCGSASTSSGHSWRARPAGRDRRARSAGAPRPDGRRPDRAAAPPPRRLDRSAAGLIDRQWHP